MTVALGRKAEIDMPAYAEGCKRGHAMLEFEPGVCFRCGHSAVPEANRLTAAQLAAIPRSRKTESGGLTLLTEVVLQTRLKLRALALLEYVDIFDQDEWEQWAAMQLERSDTVDHQLASYSEDDVRWAFKAAYV